MNPGSNFLFRVFTDNGAMPDGTQAAFIQGDANGNGLLTQMAFGFTNGASYQVRYFENARICCSNVPFAEVRIGGQTVVLPHAVPPVGGTHPYHQVLSDIFVATNSSLELAFITSNPQGGDNTLLIDNVSISKVSPTQLPVAVTLAADAFATNSARLNGQVNPSGSSTAAWFQWGTNTFYGNLTTTQAVGSAGTPAAVNAPVSGLLPPILYHYRLVASNAFGISVGADQTFTTTAPAPGCFPCDTNPPPAPGSLSILQLGPSPNRVAIIWDSVEDTGGGAVNHYNVYRDGVELATGIVPSDAGELDFVDTYLLAGHTYSYQVAAVDNSGNVSPLSTNLVVTALPLTPISGTKSVKVILLRFADFPDTPFTTNDANNLVFNGPFSVKKFYEEVSYGNVTLSGDTMGWYTLPHPGSYYCTFTLNGGLWYGCESAFGQILTDAYNLIPNSSNLPNYDVVLWVIHGMGTVGESAGNYKFISADTGFLVEVVAHEIGHGFNGVQHAAGLDVCGVYLFGPDLFNLTSAGCSLGRYSDDYDTMAAGNSYHFNMFIKEKMGFLQPSNILTVTNDGYYALYRAETPTNAVQMIKLPLVDEMFYFLEYRTMTGFDSPGTPDPGHAPGPIDGVLIHLRPSKYPGTDADTILARLILNPGTPFVDPYRHMVVEVTQKLGDHVIVRVSGLNPFKVTNTQRLGSDVQLIFNTMSGTKYDVQSSSNLVTWQTIQTNILANGFLTTNILTGAATNPKNFFRLGVDPIQ